MANISNELSKIRAANWGGDLRSSIADALEKVNNNEGGGSGEGSTDNSIVVVTTAIFNSAQNILVGDMTKDEIDAAFEAGKVVILRTVFEPQEGEEYDDIKGTFTGLVVRVITDVVTEYIAMVWMMGNEGPSPRPVILTSGNNWIGS